MNEQEIYESWLKEKTEIPVPDGFSDQVMFSVFQSQAQKSQEDRAARGLAGRIAAIPIVQIAISGSLIMLGCLRFFSVFGALVP